MRMRGGHVCLAAPGTGRKRPVRGACYRTTAGRNAHEEVRRNHRRVMFPRWQIPSAMVHFCQYLGAFGFLNMSFHDSCLQHLDATESKTFTFFNISIRAAPPSQNTIPDVFASRMACLTFSAHQWNRRTET
jgi:hypothetical protein